MITCFQFIHDRHQVYTERNFWFWWDFTISNISHMLMLMSLYWAKLINYLQTLSQHKLIHFSIFAALKAAKEMQATIKHSHRNNLTSHSRFFCPLPFQNSSLFHYTAAQLATSLHQLHIWPPGVQFFLPRAAQKCLREYSHPMKQHQRGKSEIFSSL